MKQILLKPLAGILLAAIFASCVKSEQETQQQGTEETPVLSKATYTSDTGTSVAQVTFSYDVQGNLKRIEHQRWDTAAPQAKEQIEIMDVEAQPNGMPYTIHYYQPDRGAYLTVSYEHLPGHDVVQKRTYAPGWSQLREKWLGLDAQGRVVMDTTFDVPNKKIESYAQFTYDDSDNVVKTEVYAPDSSGAFVHATTNVYTYDRHPNPFYTFKYIIGTSGLTPYFTYFGKNNMLTHHNTTYRYGQSGFVRQYAYEYNSMGWPAKRHAVGTSTVITFEYAN